ncbi:MAG: BACON domain-containing protein [Alistipes sp.]|nr:BACON domain-containing protein [Alistipes sp.]
MKLRRLFFALLALPLAFVACTEPDEPVVENKEYNLNVTSELVLSFEAEGGQGVITYELVEETRNSPVPMPVVEATCDAEWITDLVVAENITFNVAANEAEARTTKVVVSYGEQRVEVEVEQAAKNVTPVDGVVFEAQVLTGQYYGDYYTPDAGNYYIFFTDNGFSEDGDFLPNSTYYQLDVYGVLYEGESVDGYIPLPEGTYTLDEYETMAVGTIGIYYSGYVKTNDTEEEVEAYFEAAELVVAADGSCVLTATVDGEKHTVTFSGQSTISDNRINTGGEEQSMEAGYAYAYYYGDQYTPGVADNFYFFLSDLGVDADGWELANATYYRFDLYSELVDSENGLAIPYGTYTIDNGSCDPYTIGAYYSAYYVMDSDGWDYAAEGTITSGTVVIDENGVTANIMVNGALHTVTYTGAIEVIDAASGGGDEDDGPYSTLYDDLRCNLDDHSLYYQYYGDYYETGYMNWAFAIMPNDGEGDFVQFDVLAGPDSTTNFYGEYTIADTFEAYTSYTGYIDWDGNMVGAWYYTDDGITMAPFVDGTMSVVDNGDGTATVEFDVYDDYGYNITGSWTGAILSVDQMSTRSQSLKKAESKQVNIPVKSAIKVKKSDISKF